MNRMRRILALLLALCLCLLPAGALAEENGEHGPAGDVQAGDNTQTPGEHPGGAEGTPSGSEGSEGENPLTTPPGGPDAGQQPDGAAAPDGANDPQPLNQPAGAPLPQPVGAPLSMPEQINLDSPAASGVGWELDGNTVKLTGPGPFEISGNTSTLNVEVTATGTVTVTLNGAHITAPSDSAFDCGDADVVLMLAGDNTLEGSNNRAGLHCGENASLTIDGSGSLEATGSSGGAGIGSGAMETSGAITINGGTVKATGSGMGAGIGGGVGGSCGDITINGGTVTAEGGNSAGIGGGNSGTGGGNVRITGGTVYATGRGASGDIGSGGSGNGGSLEVTGGTLYLTNKGTDADNPSFRDCTVIDKSTTPPNYTGVYDANGNKSNTVQMININDPVLSGGYGPGWSYDGSAVTINNATGGHYYIYGTGTSTTNRVVVDTTDPVTITLDGVDASISSSTVALSCRSGTELHITLVGDNDLAGDPGLRISPNASLTVDGSGTLTAAGAGGGGVLVAENASLTLNGGSLTGTSNNSGVRIEGNGSLTLDGGSLTASGAMDGVHIYSGASLTVGGSGSLTATGDNGSGVRVMQNASLNLDGGDLTATGNNAGIATATATVTVTGGTHRATSPSGGTGASIDTLILNGGDFTASGGVGLAVVNPVSFGGAAALTATNTGTAGDLPVSTALTGHRWSLTGVDMDYDPAGPGFTVPVPGGNIPVTVSLIAPAPPAGGSTRSGGGNNGGSNVSTAPTALPVIPAHAAWRGEDEGLTFTVADAAPAGLVSVAVDGVVLEPTLYELRAGSVVLTLPAGYLETLAPGEHSLRLQFWNSSAAATFSVQPTGSGAGEAQPGGAGETQPGGSGLTNDNPATGGAQVRVGAAWVLALAAAGGALCTRRRR